MKRLLIVAYALVAIAGSLFAVPPVYAQSQQDLINDAKCQEGDRAACAYCRQDNANCSDKAATADCRSTEDCNLVYRFLNPFIKMLTVLVGVAVVIGIAIGGLQYAGSAGDASKVAAAKTRIRNSVVALIMYFFLYALLQFLIPGQGLLVD